MYMLLSPLVEVAVVEVVLAEVVTSLLSSSLCISYYHHNLREFKHGDSSDE